MQMSSSLPASGFGGVTLSAPPVPSDRGAPPLLAGGALGDFALLFAGLEPASRGIAAGRLGSVPQSAGAVTAAIGESEGEPVADADELDPEAEPGSSVAVQPVMAWSGEPFPAPLAPAWAESMVAPVPSGSDGAPGATEEVESDATTAELVGPARRPVACGRGGKVFADAPHVPAGASTLQANPQSHDQVDLSAPAPLPGGEGNAATRENRIPRGPTAPGPTESAVAPVGPLESSWASNPAIPAAAAASADSLVPALMADSARSSRAEERGLAAMPAKAEAFGAALIRQADHRRLGGDASDAGGSDATSVAVPNRLPHTALLPAVGPSAADIVETCLDPVGPEVADDAESESSGVVATPGKGRDREAVESGLALGRNRSQSISTAPESTASRPPAPGLSRAAVTAGFEARTAFRPPVAGAVPQPAENIAGAADDLPNLRPASAERTEIKVLTAQGEQPAREGPALGTGVAKSDPAMSLAHSQRRPLVDFVPQVTSLITTSDPVETARSAAFGETSSAVRIATRAVNAVAEIKEQFAAGGSQVVNLRFTFAGADLAVRVESRSGEVHVTFRSDSTELRTALAEEWRAVSATEAGRPLRAIDPVFATAASPERSHATSDTSSGASSLPEQRESDSRQPGERPAAARGLQRFSSVQPARSPQVAQAQGRPLSPQHRLQAFA